MVEAVTDELVVSVETDKTFAARLLTFIEDTDIALVHVSALLTPLVRTMFVGTGVKRPLMVILNGDIKNRALRTLVETQASPHPSPLERTRICTDLHGDTLIFTGIHRSS
jgi:hypothetical protein